MWEDLTLGGRAKGYDNHGGGGCRPMDEGRTELGGNEHMIISLGNLSLVTYFWQNETLLVQFDLTLAY